MIEKGSIYLLIVASVFFFLLLLKEGVRFAFYKNYIPPLPREILESEKIFSSTGEKRVSLRDLEKKLLSNVFALKKKTSSLKQKKNKEVKKEKVLAKKDVYQHDFLDISLNSLKRRFKLKGVVIGKHKSWAVIEDTKERKESLWEQGDTFFSYGRIVEIKKDRIKVQVKRGVLELYLEEKKLPSKAENKKHISSLVKDKGNGVWVISRKDFQKIVKNVDSFLTDAYLVPYKKGKWEGWLIKKEKPAGVYAKLGLQEGDVLLEINGYSLSNPEILLKTFTALQQGVDSMEIELVRKGRKEKIIYQVVE